MSSRARSAGALLESSLFTLTYFADWLLLPASATQEEVSRLDLWTVVHETRERSLPNSSSPSFPESVSVEPCNAYQMFALSMVCGQLDGVEAVRSFGDVSKKTVSDLMPMTNITKATSTARPNDSVRRSEGVWNALEIASS